MEYALYDRILAPDGKIPPVGPPAYDKEDRIADLILRDIWKQPPEEASLRAYLEETPGQAFEEDSISVLSYRNDRAT